MEDLYTSKNFGTRLMHSGRLNQLLQLIPQNTKNLLDVGCGGGHLMQRISTTRHNQNNQDIKVTGIDISKTATNSTKEKCKDAEIITADMSAYNFGKRKFDTIICTEVLEHIENYKLVIEKMESLLEEGGTLIISFPNERNIMIGRFFLGRNPVKIPEHINSFNPREIRSLIKLKVEREQAIPKIMPWELSLARIMCFKKEKQEQTKP